jgi:signal transduction histidine kinase/ActR/RegA family two-component response regulator
MVEERIDEALSMAPGNHNSGQSAGMLAFAEPEATTGSSAWDAEAAALALADSVPCGVLLFGPDGELRTANAHLAEQLAVSAADLMALGSFERLIDALAPSFADPAATAGRWRERRQAGQPCWDELKLVSPKLVQLERFGRPIIDLQGRPAGWLEIYRDVTGQKLVEGNLFQIERMVTLGQLVSNVAHELSHPLTSILGYAQLLRRQLDGKEMDSATASILQEAERAGRIARSLLQFGRGAKPERAPVFLNEIVRGILALRTRELAREHIRVDLELEPDLPPVLGDAGQLQQVLLNLLLNSEQAIRQVRGHGTIHLRTRLAGTERVSVEVADDGPGIAPELLPRIFDPFFTTKPAAVGTGLGLSIAYGIAHDHGGTVSVESRPGGGATFTMELPTAPAPPIAARSLPREDVQPAAAAVRRLDGPARSETILVIEDEPAVAHLIADVLAEDGHHPETVLDSREGLARIGKKAYDLVICDLRMPHLSGRSLFQELQRRRHPLCRRFIFVTGDAFSPRTAHFLKAAGVPYLAKPFLIDELKDVLHRVLAQDPGKPLAAVRPGQKRQIAW